MNGATVANHLFPTPCYLLERTRGVSYHYYHAVHILPFTLTVLRYQISQSNRQIAADERFPCRMWIDTHVEATDPSSARLTASDPPCRVCILLFCLHLLLLLACKDSCKVQRGGLDLGSAGETGASIAMFQPVCGSGDSCNQPKERTGQVYPHGMLHAFDVSVSMGIFVDVKLSEDAK